MLDLEITHFKHIYDLVNCHLFHDGDTLNADLLKNGKSSLNRDSINNDFLNIELS